jgi:hypothetical protein
MLVTLAGMTVCFGVAFLLACWDPIWGRRTSFRAGISAVIDKD